ncbi:MAG TPA: rRNA pseudouridine synthase [Candidatus Avamphibacillus intestinigallinarum]|nr:rRNA pseudouridine synthase [Candidatus Avamphibacillus intestinigallinarum]
MQNKSERLQKRIAKSGVTSRRKAEELIVQGKVRVNQKIVTELGTKVTDKDKIEVNNIPITEEQKVYYLLYKPRGIITSAKDDKGRKTVLDYFTDIPERIYPVGRLDYDSSGILVLTNDGDFANLLMHPRHKINKVYVAKIKGIPEQKELQSLKKGIRDQNELLKLKSYKVISKDTKQNTMVLQIVLQEGKNRHIRRMMEGLGYPVQKLKREQYGMLNLKGLQPGKYRKLTAKEIDELKKAGQK